MRPRYIILNSTLFVFSLILSYFVLYLDSSASFVIHLISVFVVAAGFLYLCFGKKIFFWRHMIRKEEYLQEARYLLLIVGIVQMIFPLIGTFEIKNFLYFEFLIGVVMVITYFSKNYWGSILVLTAYSLYILIQNLENRDYLYSIPSYVAITYELIFLYKMFVVGKKSSYR